MWYGRVDAIGGPVEMPKVEDDVERDYREREMEQLDRDGQL